MRRIRIYNIMPPSASEPRHRSAGAAGKQIGSGARRDARLPMGEALSILTTLERRVRLALNPNEPRLLSTYLALCREFDSFDTHARAFDLLVETIEDPGLPRHWRCLCLDHLYLALDALSARARSVSEHERRRRAANRMARLAIRN